MAEPAAATRTATVEKKPVKPVDTGTTIAVAPIEIHCAMLEDFESKPLWSIYSKKGLGFWPEASRGVWDKKDFKDTERVTGEALEIESADSAAKNHYVLIQHGTEKVWINVGKVKSGSGYSLGFEYATQKRTAQYGIHGVAQATYGGKTLDFKLMAVRAKTRREGDNLGTRSGDFTLVGPGLYRGYVQARQKYVNEHGDDGLYRSVSIYVWGQFEDGKWVGGVRKKSGRSTNIFIHPAHIPDWLDGCLALGYNTSDYGFESAEDSTKAMRAVFELLGITTKAEYTKAQKLADAKKPKVIITMTDKRPGSTDKAVLRIRVPIDPTNAATADDTFRLVSSDGSSYDKTLRMKDDAEPGDKVVDLVFEEIDRSLSYSLEIDPGADGEKYFLFEDLPYSQLASVTA